MKRMENDGEIKALHIRRAGMSSISSAQEPKPIEGRIR